MTEVQVQDVIPAPYGQACEECARSKTKCMLSRQGGSCQRPAIVEHNLTLDPRCRRLARDCRLAPARRRRRPPTRDRSVGIRSSRMTVEQADRTGRLEEKLQEVMTLLRSSASVATTESASSSPQTSMEGSHSIDSVTHLPPLSSIDLAVDLSLPEADEYLTTFVATKLPHFPVLHISGDVTSQQLRDQRPFLWLSIMAVSTASMSRQRQLTLALKDHLSQVLLRRSERSLDLLMGLLVTLGWNNRSTDVDTKIPLSVLSQIAVAVLYDLGLNKQPRSDAQQTLCVAGPRPAEDSRVRTMEQRRAALGCFVITSVISSFLQKTDALRWTGHLAESLSELADRQECPNDSVLVSQVQAQLVVEKASMLRWYDEAIETAEVLKTPPALYVQALHLQLDGARKGLPLQLLPRSIALLHVSHAELVINELALNTLLASTSSTNLQRLKFLTACLTSIKTWFETFFALPIIEYANCGFSVMSQLVRCLHLLYILTTFEDSAGIGWDTAEVRSSLDVLSVLDRVISNFAQVDSEINKVDDRLDFFAATVQRFSFMRSTWATTLEEKNSRTHSIDSGIQLWTPSDESELGVGMLEDWNSIWLDDGWSTNLGLSGFSGG